MACDSPFDAFRMHTELLTDTIYRHPTFGNNIWTQLVPRGIYPHGQGISRSYFTVHNQSPLSDDATWETIAAPGAGAPGDNVHGCIDTWNDTSFGFLEETYGLERRQFRGPVICRDQLMFNHNFEQFLMHYIDTVTKNVTEEISNRYEAIYRQFSRKAVLTASGIVYYDNPGTVGNTMDDSTCALTLDHLDQVAMELILQGAQAPDPKGFLSVGADGPLYSLAIGPDSKHTLAKIGSAQRDDFRYAEPSELMKRIGAVSTIRNWRFVPWLMPRRYTFAAGDYTPVPRHIAVAGGEITKGAGTKVNPAWKSAPYESAIVLNPDVFTSEIVPPLMSAAGVSWQPETHTGEWKWVTGTEASETQDCYDPLHNRGRHFAEFYHAPKPGRGKMKYGVEIIFPRVCVNSLGCETCSG